MAAAALAGVAISAYGAYDANQKGKKAKESLEQWNKTNSQNFKTADQLQLEAEASTPSGYSPAEKAAFQQNMARRNNQVMRSATDRNPNLSGAVNAAINYGNIQGMLDFSARDAQLRRSMISEKIGINRGQSNAQTQFNQNVAGQYGQAIQQQRENMTSSLYNVANAAAAYGYYKGGTGTQKTTAIGDVSTGNALGGQAPLQSLQNPTIQSSVGTDAWAQNLYGNPNPKFSGMMNNTAPSGPVKPYPLMGNMFTNPYSY